MSLSQFFKKRIARDLGVLISEVNYESIRKARMALELKEPNCFKNGLLKLLDAHEIRARRERVNKFLGLISGSE
jgi:hypothetical protein